MPLDAVSSRKQNSDEQVQGALDRVAELICSAEVFLFIKGSPQQPMCGFSANTMAIMNALGRSYSTFDVLSDDDVRGAAKEHAEWPTFPQVWVRGEFIGGNDIVTEMYQSGELQEMFSELDS
ncbi:MAG: Grx4 family monothiol glutaredoxin [bacterium]|nr:Grx4 family monothiol glutaredoxin [bacterium]